MKDPLSSLSDLVANMPDDPAFEEEVKPNRSLVHFPARYREEWGRPDDTDWHGRFDAVLETVCKSGIICMTGNRGTGKTRIAAEVARDYSRTNSHHTTAMGLFLRIRGTYGKKGDETEETIVRELSTIPLLVLDEIQERGNSEWEDRLLTHLIDNRYNAMKPTIMIANVTRPALIKMLGDSIVSRIAETGGFLEVTGKSFRNPS